jgi:hypothetical protein
MCVCVCVQVVARSAELTRLEQRVQQLSESPAAAAARLSATPTPGLTGSSKKQRARANDQDLAAVRPTAAAASSSLQARGVSPSTSQLQPTPFSSTQQSAYRAQTPTPVGVGVGKIVAEPPFDPSRSLLPLDLARVDAAIYSIDALQHASRLRDQHPSLSRHFDSGSESSPLLRSGRIEEERARGESFGRRANPQLTHLNTPSSLTRDNDISSMLHREAAQVRTLAAATATSRALFHPYHPTQRDGEKTAYVSTPAAGNPNSGSMPTSRRAPKNDNFTSYATSHNMTHRGEPAVDRERETDRERDRDRERERDRERQRDRERDRDQSEHHFRGRAESLLSQPSVLHLSSNAHSSGGRRPQLMLSPASTPRSRKVVTVGESSEVLARSRMSSQELINSLQNAVMQPLSEAIQLPIGNQVRAGSTASQISSPRKSLYSAYTSQASPYLARGRDRY